VFVEKLSVFFCPKICLVALKSGMRYAFQLSTSPNISDPLDLNRSLEIIFDIRVIIFVKPV